MENLIQKYWKKIVSLVLIWILFFSQNFVWITFAKDESQCNSCGGSTAELQEYQDFIYEVLDSIDTTVPKGDYLWKTIHPGLFEAGYYKIPEENKFILASFADKIFDDLKRTAGAMEMMAIMAWSFWVEFVQLHDDGILLLFEQEPFVLAYSAMLKVDTAIHDKMFDLGLAGAWYSKLTEINRLKLEKILKKYSAESDNIFDTYDLSSDVRYSQVVKMLRKLNSVMKTLVGCGWDVECLFKDGLPENWVKIGWSNISVLVYSSVFTVTDEEFACARRLECSEAMKNFGENMWKIGEDSSDSFRRSWDLIKESAKDLKNMFGTIWAFDGKTLAGNELSDAQKDFLEEEDHLFRSLYGIRSSEVLKWGLLSQNSSFRTMLVDENMKPKDYFEQKIWENNVDAVEEKTKQVFELAKDAKAEIERINFQKDWTRTTLFCLNNNKESLKIVRDWIMTADSDSFEMVDSCDKVRQIYTVATNNIAPKGTQSILEALNPINPQSEIDSMKKYFNFNVGQVFEKQSVDVQFAVIAGNRDVIMFFSDIFDELDLTEELIWTKDTDGLLSNLGQACELQCENKWWLCYR